MDYTVDNVGGLISCNYGNWENRFPEVWVDDMYIWYKFGTNLWNAEQDETKCCLVSLKHTRSQDILVYCPDYSNSRLGFSIWQLHVMMFQDQKQKERKKS